jgi:hypothetical protein
LYEEFVVVGVTEVIVKHKPSSPILPADHLAETQIVEDEGIAPSFSGVESLGESF